MSFFALAMRNLTLRKWRTAMLLVGYGLGVATMIVLLSIGEALVLQASDEKLVGGGEITVLPQGIDVEVMKTGGLGGMFFSIDHSRFVHRQLLGGPRARAEIAGAAPQMTGKLLYVTAGGRTIPVLASGEIPSLTRAVDAMPKVVRGAWTDDESDRRWMAPTPFELRHEIDRFHLPPADARGDSTWGEWHYFNVLWPGGRKWAFVSLIIGGAVPDARWGGQVLVTLHEIGRRPRRFVSYASPEAISFSTSTADVKIGKSSVGVMPNGDYRVVIATADEVTGAPLVMDMVVAPSPGAYFPGAAIGGTALVSGYVVPALRASASGRFCVAGQCDELAGVQSYHDHNWGIWRDVAWEWGEATAGDYTVLYGRIMSDGVADQPLFLYLVDSLGFVALFRPKVIDYVDGRTASVDGRIIRVPSRAVMRDARGDDHVVLELEVEDAAATDVRKDNSQKIGRISRTSFVQMKGVARITGRINGRAIGGTGQGFFETYR
jgi:hypothetical protein